MKADTPGLLLVNLGTPDAAEPAAVRRYLKGLLSDPRVLDIPALPRWLLVNGVILPFRTRGSTEAYRKIWTDHGSPLLVHGEALRARVQEKLGRSAVVRLGMCLGRPSIPEAFAHFRRHGVRRIVVCPLYPQCSAAATGSALDQVYDTARSERDVPSLQVIPPFFDHHAFLDAHAALARPILDEVRPERVFFSFHGLPERQVRASDPSGAHCLASPDCCERFGEANLHCYRAQCFRTAEHLRERLGIEPERAVTCFQSRLGRTPWIRPYTDETIREAARSGVRRAAILSPAFVADCLETLEELGIRAVEDWKANGGERLELVPSLNASGEWVDALVRIVKEGSSWLET